MRELKEDSLESVFQENKTTVVDFHATWCSPCQVLDPILADLAKEVPDVSFVKADVEQCPILASKFGIYSVPTIVIFQDGIEVRRFVGLQQKTVIRDAVLAMKPKSEG